MREVEQGVAVSDADLLRPRGDPFDRLPALHRALGQHAQIKARSVVGYEQGRHVGLVHADPDAEARHSRLGDLEEHLADPVAITNADLVVLSPSTVKFSPN